MMLLITRNTKCQHTNEIIVKCGDTYSLAKDEVIDWQASYMRLREDFEMTKKIKALYNQSLKI